MRRSVHGSQALLLYNLIVCDELLRPILSSFCLPSIYGRDCTITCVSWWWRSPWEIKDLHTFGTTNKWSDWNFISIKLCLPSNLCLARIMKHYRVTLSSSVPCRSRWEEMIDLWLAVAHIMVDDQKKFYDYFICRWNEPMLESMSMFIFSQRNNDTLYPCNWEMQEAT